MKGVRQVMLMVTAVVVAALSGCRYHAPLDSGLEPTTLAVEAEVTDVVAFSGSAPAGVAVGQHIIIAVTFLAAHAHLIHSDSRYAVYDLDRHGRNAIRVTLGTLNWSAPLSQVLVSDDVPVLGDRLALSGSAYTSSADVYASFDCRDSAPPFDMLSSFAFPTDRVDVKEQVVTGGGMLKMATDASSWRIRFSCRQLSVR